MSMTTKEMIEVMQAYEEGKKIERRHRCTDVPWENEPGPYWNWVIFEYRVKKEPKYRPYKDTAEMIADWIERFGTYDTKVVMPPIWLMCGETRSMVTDYLPDFVYAYATSLSMRDLYEDYTYLDGSPCGKEVTE